MASVSWPPPGSTDFPQDVFSGYQYQHVDTRLQTTMDMGVVKTRQDVTKPPRRLRAPIKLNGEQLDVFETFLANTNYGALRFDWVDPFDGTALEMRFQSIPQFQEIVGSPTKAKRWYSATLDLWIPPQ